MSSKHNYKKLSSKAFVQVICVTYNQKEYIKDALDSFLMQKTNFKFEVLVGDDCSTDGTSEIVAQYAKKYPNIIKHIKRNKNIGSLANFMDLCETVTAKYVAFCDGDDYWTDEHKLQKQYDYMEKNEDVNICGCCTYVKCAKEMSDYKFFSTGKRPFTIPRNLPLEQKLTINDYIQDTVHTSSVFVRWQRLKFPKWMYKGILGDIPMFALQIGNGFLYVLKDQMAVYRKNINGVMSDAGSEQEHFLETRIDYFRVLEGIISYFESTYPKQNISNIKLRLNREVNNYADAVINLKKEKNVEQIKYTFPNIYKILKYKLKKYKIINGLMKCKYILKKCIFVKKESKDKKILYIFNIPFYSEKMKSGRLKKKFLGITISKVKLNTETTIAYNRIQYLQNIEKKVSLLSSQIQDIYTKIYASQLHQQTFQKYMCCNEGKDVVVVACGPTVNYFKGIKNAVFMGMNRAFMQNNFLIDYLFIQDNMPNDMEAANNYRPQYCKKFYGILPHYRAAASRKFDIFPISFLDVKKANAERFILEDYPNNYWPEDISYEPFKDLRATIFVVMQFALYTFPKRIFLVGNDCSNTGHFYNPEHIKSQKFNDRVAKWRAMKGYIEKNFPNLEIISINPIGIKGLFRDVYTEDFLEGHPEILKQQIEIINEKGDITWKDQ